MNKFLHNTIVSGIFAAAVSATQAAPIYMTADFSGGILTTSGLASSLGLQRTNTCSGCAAGSVSGNVLFDQSLIPGSGTGTVTIALAAVAALDSEIDKAGITHLIVASCTGFMAPGLDQAIVAGAGLDPGVERTVVGFMGCYAAFNGIKAAHAICKSNSSARVLVVCTELCSLHFQPRPDA